MKRIILSILLRDAPTPDLWRADSTRFGVSAYGRSVKEARQRLFVTVKAEKSNMLAYFWSEEFVGFVIDSRPRV